MASSKLETVKIRPKWELHIDPHFLPTRGVMAIQTNERLIPHMQVSHQGYKNVGPNEKLQLIPRVSLSLSLSLSFTWSEGYLSKEAPHEAMTLPPSNKFHLPVLATVLSFQENL